MDYKEIVIFHIGIHRHFFLTIFLRRKLQEDLVTELYSLHGTWGLGRQCAKACNNENSVINQKILSIRFVSNLDICKIVIVCPGQHHVKAQVWSFENVREKQK